MLEWVIYSNINITKLTRTIDDYNKKLYDDIVTNI
jgi:hypothetical protein